jgi:hypothetical protein
VDAKCHCEFRKDRKRSVAVVVKVMKVFFGHKYPSLDVRIVFEGIIQ